MLVQFIGVHFLDLNPNSYDTINMKFNLHVSIKVKFKFAGPKTSVTTGCFWNFCSVSFKRDSPAHIQK